MLSCHRIDDSDESFVACEESVTTSIIRSHQRSNEEIIMFRKFWPEWIARILNREYAKAQSSNELEDEE